MMLLGEPKISGCAALSSSKGTVLVRIPDNACAPAHLCIRNVDAAAVVYLKTVRKNESTNVSATDQGVRLQPGEFYDWDGAPPRNADVIGLSTVDHSLVTCEANWALSEA